MVTLAEDSQLAFGITQIDVELIYILKVILESISSGHKIDVGQFDEYIMATSSLYVVYMDGTEWVALRIKY